jgi:hypothetical protein
VAYTVGENLFAACLLQAGRRSWPR